MSQLMYPAASLALSLILVPLIRSLARARGWIAHPTRDRWHEKPTALMGGIGIFAAMVAPLLLLAEFSPEVLFGPSQVYLHQGGVAAMVLVFGATLLFALGLVDDFLHIRPQTKLVGQILVASLVAFYGFRLQWVTSLTGDTLITILWIVGITNALNLLDNMDGLCAGVGAVGAFVIGFLLSAYSPTLAVCAWCVCAAQVGFLFYNFKPATIFMGDCGSLVIGFSLAFLTVAYSGFTAESHVLQHYAVPLLILMVPIFDTSLVTIIRVLSGRKASMGGKDHTSHRLVLVGMSEKGAVLALYITAAVSGLAAVFVDRHDNFTSPAVIVPVGVSVILMGVYLAQIRVYPEKEFSVLRDRAFTPVLMDLTFKRQLLLVLLDFCLISFAYYLSYRLRFSLVEFGQFFDVFLKSLPAVIVCKYVAFHFMGVYRGIWRYLSTNDVTTLIKATTMGSLLSVVVVTYVYRFEHFSKGIFLIDWCLVTAAILATRGSFKLWADYLRRSSLAGDRILLYGAGRGGEVLLREILNNRRLRFNPVGFVDDDPMKKGKRLQGFPILGDHGDLESLVERYEVAGIVVTFMAKRPEKIEELRRFCVDRGLFLKRFSVYLEDIEAA
ncbi:MAG: glycosyl transferase [Desulfatibacillaceae bacterium]